MYLISFIYKLRNKQSILFNVLNKYLNVSVMKPLNINIVLKISHTKKKVSRSRFGIGGLEQCKTRQYVLTHCNDETLVV